VALRCAQAAPRMALKCKGVNEEMTTGVHRIKEMAKKGESLPAINVDD
jgi:S-adenosylhomocysteine hydrolase